MTIFGAEDYVKCANRIYPYIIITCQIMGILYFGNFCCRKIAKYISYHLVPRTFY